MTRSPTAWADLTWRVVAAQAGAVACEAAWTPQVRDLLAVPTSHWPPWNLVPAVETLRACGHALASGGHGGDCGGLAAEVPYEGTMGTPTPASRCKGSYGAQPQNVGSKL